MGISTDAILFWGFHADDEWNDLFDVDDWEKVYATNNGVTEPQTPYELDKEAHRKYWKDTRELVDAEPCEIDTHCSGDYPMPLVCVKASKIKANRGYPKEVPNLKVDAEWTNELKKFCNLMNIPWQEPKWWIVSYMG